MQKGVLRIVKHGESSRVAFWCPGCKESHHIKVKADGLSGPIWGFNGDYDAPTFTPSILVRSGHYLPEHKSPECWCTYNAKHPEEPPVFECSVCHSFVTDGKIQFLSDSTHVLAGHTVALEARQED